MDAVVADMRAAVSSIPVYVGLSRYFLVLAPPMSHRDTGKMCDFESWTKRGWCRLELWSHVLREGSAKPMLLVRSERWVQFPSGHMWPLCRVHEGNLTAETDRSIIK